MKNIIYSILVCLPFVFGACDKSTDDTSKVTYFVTLEREGDEKIVLEKDLTYFDQLLKKYQRDPRIKTFPYALDTIAL